MGTFQDRFMEKVRRTAQELDYELDVESREPYNGAGYVRDREGRCVLSFAFGEQVFVVAVYPRGVVPVRDTLYHDGLPTGATHKVQLAYVQDDEIAEFGAKFKELLGATRGTKKEPKEELKEEPERVIWRVRLSTRADVSRIVSVYAVTCAGAEARAKAEARLNSSWSVTYVDAEIDVDACEKADP